MITIKCKTKVAEQLLINELKYNKNLEVSIVESMIAIKCKTKVAEQLLMNELKYNKNLEVSIVEAIIPAVELTSVIVEANGMEYEDSSDFTEDMTTIEADIIKIRHMLTSPKWKAWMKDTDQNFSTNCVEASRKAVEDLKKFETTYDKFMDEIHSAE